MTSVKTMAAAIAACAALTTPVLAAEHQQHDADNTGRNAGAREAVTPLEQSNDKADLEITRQIRKRIVDDDTMSMNARNLKIITVDGVVTLRGPVENGGERTTIATIAKGTPGVKRVDDQIDVKRQ